MKTRKAPGNIFGPLAAPEIAPGSELAVWKNYSETPAFKAQGKVTDGESLRIRLLDEFKDRFDPSRFFFLDGGFYLPTLAEVLRILAASRVALMDFATERFDCDDFAFGVKGEFSLFAYKHRKMEYGFSFGILRGEVAWEDGTHFACYFVADTGRVYLVEPRRKLVRGADGAVRRESPEEQLIDTSNCYSCDLILL